ncbi:MAG: aldehyde ferredoxin oxidoreductase C-terminal domain-containing protein, partial [Bacillota bacterium]
ELRPAQHLMGKTTYETGDAIRADERDQSLSVAAIGPAGEHLVKYALILATHARPGAKKGIAGRCGLGAVMGSKNLKAIAVRGARAVQVRRPAEFERAVREVTRKITANEFNKKRMEYGVYCYQPWGIETPYRNFQGGRVPTSEETAPILPEEFLRYKTASKGCHSCPIKCWGVYEFPGDEGRTVCEALQGNDPHNFGAKLNIFDARDILRAHALCNDLGLDTDNVCGALAWAFECYEKGILIPSDTGGLKLEWGDRDAVFHLLRDTAYRQGLGDVLAEGSLRAARILGGEEYSIHVKGQDLFECLWASETWALGTVVAARGGTHTRGAVIEERLAGLSGDQLQDIFGIGGDEEAATFDGLVRLNGFFERLEASLDCLGVCMFTNSLRADTLLPGDYASLLQPATGWDIDGAGLMEIGERVHTVEKCFNVLHRGWTRRHDYPPARFLVEPIVNGPAKGRRLDPDRWDGLLDSYYRMHGWDTRTGWPLRETLDGLGLEDIAAELERWNRLP